jgi:pyridoxal phosphate enzyme (YggS family)
MEAVGGVEGRRRRRRRRRESEEVGALTDAPARDARVVPSIRDNVAAVRAEIAAACARARRDPATVRLIAVTKSQGPEVLPALIAEGVRDFGENRVEHLAEMAASAPTGAVFHHIGRLQSRQLPEVAAHAASVHGLCEESHLDKLSRLGQQAGRRLQAFAQVNTSGEAAKAGLAPEALPAFIVKANAATGVELVGLMTMAPEIATGHADPAMVRRCFARLAELARAHDMQRLSMGMSQDFTIAIEEGATDVRVGTRLFA